MPDAATAPAGVLVEAGLELLKSNRLAEAASRFAEAARRDPTLAEAPYYLGVVRERQRDLAGAESAYRRAVALSPMAAAHDRLGFVLGQRGMTDAAIAEFERAVAIDPALADAQYHLGATLWWTKRPDLARAPLEAAVRLAPTHAEAHYYLGLTLRLLGDPRRSASLVSGRRFNSIHDSRSLTRTSASPCGRRATSMAP